MTSTEPGADRITSAGWRIVLLASLGGTLEFYDFVIFGVFAREIGEAIFPNPTPLVSLMVSFAAFGAGYLARPVGGLVLSHFGDRHGRRRVFLGSVFVMSAATLGMGLVPSFASWGAVASATMVTLRLIQGFCLGGELPGALTYVVETAPRQAPFVCAVVFSCVTFGVVVATALSVALRSWLSPPDVLAFGWRIPFVLGGLGGLLSFVLRRSLEESPEFARLKQLTARQPFREVLQNHFGPVVLGIAAVAATAAFNGLFFAHMPAYLAGVLKYDALGSVASHTVGVIAHAATILGVGWLAMQVPPRLVLGAGALIVAVLSVPFYSGLATRALPSVVLLVLAGAAAGLMNGTFASLLADLFPTRVRFTGVALVFNVSFTIFSGTAPLVATSLIGATGSTTAPAYLMAGCALVTAAAVMGLGRSGGHVMPSRAR